MTTEALYRELLYAGIDIQITVSKDEKYWYYSEFDYVDKHYESERSLVSSVFIESLTIIQAAREIASSDYRILIYDNARHHWVDNLESIMGPPPFWNDAYYMIGSNFKIVAGKIVSEEWK